MSRINVILCILFILFGCSKNEAEVKLYKTTVPLNGLQMFSDVDSYKFKVILKIPYKSKVELVDKKKYYIPHDIIVSEEYSKVKYKETIGYVLSTYLSDRDDVPFVDDIKYDYRLNEFDYDRDSIIKAAIDVMHKDGFFKAEIQYYYTENPQIFTLYGRDCDNSKVKIVAVIMVSKLHPNFNRAICFEIKGNKLGPAFGGDISTIEELIKFVRGPDECCDEGC